MLEARPPRAAGRIPWGLLAAVALLAGVGYGGYRYVTRPEPPITLLACSSPEAVTLITDDSPSVHDLDPGDTRGDTVRRILRLLAAEPCTDADVVTHISFTEAREVTGPASASALGRIRRSGGSSTDIAGATHEAFAIADERPAHRQIFIVLSDLEEVESTVPVEQSLENLADHELLVVTIGGTNTRGGNVVALDSSDDLTRGVADLINDSRSRENHQ